MLKKLFIVATACASLGFAGSAMAGDIEAGKALAPQCSGCHGANGEGAGPNPPLAGMDIDLHVKAMEDYKSGARVHAVMKMYADKLTDKETLDLAAYYASL
jgi:cytochrome c553